MSETVEIELSDQAYANLLKIKKPEQSPGEALEDVIIDYIVRLLIEEKRTGVYTE